MQRIHFFQLERPIQERFVASARGATPPAPLAIHRDLLPKGVLVWAGLSLLAVVGLIGFGSLGYGELDSDLALQPQSALAVYAVLGVLAVFAGLRAMALHLHAQALPFTPAVYLFPSGLIDARNDTFSVRSISDLRHSELKQGKLLLAFSDGYRFAFRLKQGARGQEIERLLAEFGTRFNPDAAPVSAREVAAYDPLKDTGFSNPFSPTEPMRRAKLPFRFLGPLIALVLGPLLGQGAFALRNSLAEDALYLSARTENTQAAYRAYVARGGRRTEITDILLPRTELEQIVKKAELPALEAYALPRMKSAIWPEIERELRRALLAELERVKAQDTRAALREFQTRYGRHEMIVPALERAVADQRARVLARFAAAAKPTPDTLDFFKRLLTYADAHGPRLELRFRRKLSDSVARTETQLRKSIFFGGEASLPAQYFDAVHSEKRERELANALLAQFRRAFPADALSLEPGPLLEEASEELPKVTAPTLLVSHRTEMSGAYLSVRPRAVYTGIGVLFRVSLQLPDDDKPVVHKSSSWQSPALREIRNGASFETIYEDMASKAFAKLPKRFLDELFPGFGE
jgi:hypothetical protein